MKSQKAREYFISIQIFEIFDEELSKKLNTLSLYTNGIFSLKDFNSNLSTIIDWNRVNNIKYIIESNKIPENIDFILNIHAWAKKVFQDSLYDGNMEKLIISFLIGYYLFLEPSNDFKWDNISVETKKNIEKSFTTGIAGGLRKPP
jgi:hypothetical protein